MPELNSYTIRNFIGGLADEGKIGVTGSFRRGWNLNIHQNNSLKCNQRMKKISEDVVTDLIIKIVPVTETKSYGFGNAGNVYKIEEETVTLIYTDPNGGILDAEYFYGYLYWTTVENLGRCDETSADWDIDAVPDYQELYNCQFHPIFIVPKSDQMCIGNDRYVAMFSSSENWNPEALDMFFGWTIKCLTLKKPDLLIGAKDSKKAELFTWNLTDESYDPVEYWQERDIIAFLKGVGAIYLFTPEFIQWYSNGIFEIAKGLPSETKMGATDIWKGKTMIGIKNGLYSYYKKNKNYPLALNLEFTPSPITTAEEFDTKEVEIGAVLGRGDQILLSWQDGDNYGLDILDLDAKAIAVYEGLSFDAGRPEDKLFRYIKLITRPLPVDCYVKVKYRMFEADDWVDAKMAATQTEGLTDEQYGGENFTKAVFQIEGQGEIYEVRVELYPNGNNTPEVLEVHNYFELGSNY